MALMFGIEVPLQREWLDRIGWTTGARSQRLGRVKLIRMTKAREYELRRENRGSISVRRRGLPAIPQLQFARDRIAHDTRTLNASFPSSGSNTRPASARSRSLLHSARTGNQGAAGEPGSVGINKGGRGNFSNERELADVRHTPQSVLASRARGAAQCAPGAVARASAAAGLLLFGKTQSGKTSIIRYLTGANDAQIGQGFRPCTRFSRRYQFPSAETPLVTFLDTRGLEEPGYDPQEDLHAFDREAHVMVVTVRATDHAQERVLSSLQVLRKGAAPLTPGASRPDLLARGLSATAAPSDLSVRPRRGRTGDVPDDLRRTLDEQKRRFEGLYDAVVPIDLTPVEEGFHEHQYGDRN